MGGSDQWGNIVNGIDLGHPMGTPQLYALTTPLLTTSSGAKMGKSANGRRVADGRHAEPVRLLAVLAQHRGRRRRPLPETLYTRLPLDEIARLAALGGAEINDAKKVLATEVTAMLHGRAAAEQAAETARKTFEEGTTADTLPTVTVDRALLASGVGILSLFVTAGLASSNGEARRHVQGGAVRVNDQPVPDDRHVVTDADIDRRQSDQTFARKEEARAGRPSDQIFV